MPWHPVFGIAYTNSIVYYFDPYPKNDKNNGMLSKIKKRISKREKIYFLIKDAYAALTKLSPSIYRQLFAF